MLVSTILGPIAEVGIVLEENIGGLEETMGGGGEQ